MLKKKIVFILFFLILVNADEFNLEVSSRVLLLGDVNGDCKVDIFDLTKVRLCYGCSFGEGCQQNCSVADVKKDNKVDIFDLATVGLNYGREC